MVQEGVSWFSQLGVQRKQELFTIVPGVTFYGSGFGHGVGMSQYGANGWATGGTGVTPTGEGIVARDYPGTALPVRSPSRRSMEPSRSGSSRRAARIAGTSASRISAARSA